MTEDQRKTSLYDMLYLTSCAINGAIPDRARTDKMALDEVYRLSSSHQLAAITYYALESAGLPDSETMKDWRESRDKAIRKNMLLDAGRAQIEDHLDSIGCRYMPLKGVHLKELYPKPGMRQMSDNDILFDKRYRKEIHGWFIENGYECTEYSIHSHDWFDSQKPLF